MALVGYEPHPSGNGYVFQDDSGQKMAFAGPEADQMKAWLDSTKPPDARLALNDQQAHGGPAGPVTASSLQSAPIPMDRGVVEGMNKADAAPIAGSQYAPEDPEAFLRQKEESKGQGPFSGDAGVAYALRKRVVPGRPAITSQDLEQKASEARALPVAKTVTGGIDETDEQKQARLAQEDQRHAAEHEAVAAVDQAGADKIAAYGDQQTYNLNEALRSQVELGDALKRQKEIEQMAAPTLAKLEADRDAIAKQKVDPQRLFHEKGAAASITSVIAMALGAFGAAMTHSPNFAQQIIEGAIQRDVDSQLDALHRKGEAANNAISTFERHYGLDRAEAINAVKSAQLRYAASMTDLYASKIGSAEAKQQAAITKANLLAQAEQRDAELRAMYQGRTANQYQYAMTQKAQAGGYRDPTDEEITKGAAAGTAVNKMVEGEGAGSETNARGLTARIALQKNNLERRVRLPDGGFAWVASADERKIAQDNLHGVAEYRKNLAEIRSILSHAGSSLDPDSRERVKVLAAANTNLEKEIQGFTRLSDADIHLVSPLTGASANDIFRMKSSILKGLDVAEQNAVYNLRKTEHGLYKDPNAQEPLHRDTEDSIGITVGR